MNKTRPLCAWLLGWVLLMGHLGAALAGSLGRADLEKRFQPPLHVGEKLADVPVWPITSELLPEAGPVAYVFESIDFAPIPGFEGTPFNLLIALDHKGAYMAVEVLHQHEPVFLGGLGEKPLNEFVSQYVGHNLKQEITISSAYGNTRAGVGGNRVVLDGVAKATASIRIVNQTVLTAALAVARAKLGMAAPAARGPAASVRDNDYRAMDFATLLKDGHVKRLRLSYAQAEALFAGSDGAGLDERVQTQPDDAYIDLYVAYLNAPTIGRAIMGDEAYARMMKRLEPGQQVYWVANAGPYLLIDERFVPGTQPQWLAMVQDDLPFELRDLNLDPPAPPGAPAFNASLVLKVPPLSGLDPGRGVRFDLTLTRAKGLILPVITQRTASLEYQAPRELFDYPPTPLPDWLIAWRDRLPDLAIIAGAFLLLSVVLARPRWMSVSAPRLARFRVAFLAFTLGFLGWYAQGQLSIVQITGAIKSLSAGQGLKSFLYDPVSLLVIAFTLITFVLWGRGTFCGWLCPFGALQEFAAMLGRRLGIRSRRLPRALATALSRGRYLILGGLVACAAFAPTLAEKLVEIEPFKTSITVGFDRSWPFVAYALGLLLLGAVYYKFFCRFLCPLGAAMTLGGKLRLLDWLPRRTECGKPCQTCRHRCEYDAIDRSNGKILYDDCFQCLDCVGIYHDERRCAPLILYRRKGRQWVPAPLD